MFTGTSSMTIATCPEIPKWQHDENSRWRLKAILIILSTISLVLLSDRFQIKSFLSGWFLYIPGNNPLKQEIKKNSKWWPSWISLNNITLVVADRLIRNQNHSVQFCCSYILNFNLCKTKQKIKSKMADGGNLDFSYIIEQVQLLPDQFEIKSIYSTLIFLQFLKLHVSNRHEIDLISNTVYIIIV